MAQWKCTREKLELFPHPNPIVKRLELGKVGQYQVVVGKGIFQHDSIVIFVPEKSVLPDAIADDGDRRKYLVGPFKNRVKALTMQKELTQGIILDDRPEFADIPLGEDISEKLGIVKYVAPVPDELSGKVVSFGEVDTDIHQHDVEQYNIYAREFVSDEPVMVTEKINGTQGVYVRLADGKRLVSSKGLLHNDQFFAESSNNAYKRGEANVKLFDLLDKHFPGVNVTAFGEVNAGVKGFTYGHVATSVFLYRIDVKGETLAYSDVPDDLKKLWVPILYTGPFDINVIRPLREGKETVSGTSLHIKEGIVITPIAPRKANGFRLYLKLINPKYVADDENDIN